MSIEKSLAEEVISIIRQERDKAYHKGFTKGIQHAVEKETTDCCFRRVSSRAYAGNERFIRHPSSIGRKYHLALTREMKTCGVHNCRCSISVASYVRRGK